MEDTRTSRLNSFFSPQQGMLFAVLGIFIIYPFVANNYYTDVAFFFGIYALLGLSLNVVLGEVGLFDLGHAGFYA
ncbi:MAG TPA: hypothetical protein PLA74_03550, partial [Syntrophales bacterium]|nr:hypothetical protein [Syntrophales bacterium]